MTKSDNTKSHCQCNVLTLLIIILICLCYSNTLNSSWHLDDEPNIITNAKLHLTEISPEQIKNALTANPTTPDSTNLYRPIPCLTLALNWYFGQDNVLGYHLVNISIHLLCTFFLSLTLRLMLKIYYKNDDPPFLINTAALLGALLWALAPIQTQAVTYIIQRMASMAALFTILAIYAYLRGRINKTKHKYAWFTLCLVSFFAALGSKENSIILPASLFLIEITFLQHTISKRNLGRLLAAGTFALLSGFIFVRYGLEIHPFNFLDSYSHRSFTFNERILTEPRVLVTYLTQTLLPLPMRLSIEHDITTSTSFFFPWTTLPAIFCVLTFLFLSTFYLKKYPIFTFPIIYFFLNHLVESTIIPLELIFEHRNYLPSFFLFLPFGFLIAQALYGPNDFSSLGRIAIMLCSALFLMISGHATYTRNFAWATEGSLWKDAFNKAPQSARAAHSLGRWYRQFGKYELAYFYFKLALQNADKASTPKMTQNSALNGLASVSYMLGQYKQSLIYFDQCLKNDKTDEACLKNRAMAYLHQGLHQKAETDAIHLSERYPTSLEYQYVSALSAYYAEDFNTAQSYLEKFASKSIDNDKAMHLTGLILMKSRSYSNSIFFLKRAVKLTPDNIDYKMTLAGCYYSNNNFALAEATVNDIFEIHSIQAINMSVMRIQQYGLDSNIISSIKEKIASLIKTTNELNNG